MPKNGYKIEKLRFGKLEEIPKEWNEKRLDFFLTLNMGQSPPSVSYNSEGEGIPFVQGVTEFGEKYPLIQIWCTQPKKIAEKNEILFSVRAPVGQMNLSNTKICIGRGISSLKPKGANNLLYCYYLLQQYVDRLIPFCQGIPYDAINKPSLAHVTFPFTENENEQKEIAKKISNVDEMKQKINKLIDQMKLLKEKMMQELLTKGINKEKTKPVQLIPRWNKEKIPENWDAISISKIGRIITGSTPSTSNPDFYGSEYLWASPEDIEYDSKFLVNTNKKLTKKGFDNSRAFHEKSILFVCIGSTIGKVTIAGKKMATNQQINTLVCREYEPEFVYYQLLFHCRKIKILANEVGVPIMNKGDFGNYKIPIPKDTGEQKELASILSNIDNIIKKYQEYKSKIELIKKDMMQKLLTGEMKIKG